MQNSTLVLSFMGLVYKAFYGLDLTVNVFYVLIKKLSLCPFLRFICFSVS